MRILVLGQEARYRAYCPPWVRLEQQDLTFLDKFLNLLPNQLLEVYRVISGDSLYELAGHVFGALPLLFLIYGCLCLGLIPVICLIYRRTVVQ